MTLFWFALGVLGLFVLVVLRGAPYVPTLRPTVRHALDMLPLKPGSVIVDLGSGDGVFIRAAAQRGYKAVGYELNPILCVIAWLRCLPVRDRVRIKLRDFWLSNLPTQTDAVFVFLAGPYMKRLSRYLQKAMAKRGKPLFIVSHGFAIPGLVAQKQEAGLYLYKLAPSKR